MSIKYLQDQQLNQVQQSPNNSPWAKLIAQSEMLERNKMRQPQGQAPQGTVAGNIQQQLMATQQQEGERENADLYKSQMLAQLIGSGQIPANFMSSSQGYADGGLTQPQAGTGAYRGIMVPSQTASPMGMQHQTAYRPPNSQDPAAQEKKHGLIQSLIDNSIFKAPTTESFMNNLGDMASGKFLSRGFAEGGDVRGFAAGGETMAEQLARIRPQIEATLKDQGWTKEAIDRYVSAYKPEMGRGFTNPEAQKLLTGVRSQPKALPHIAQVSESPELQDYYKSLYGPKPEATRSDILSQLGKTNAPGEAQMRIPTREAMLRQAQGATTGTDSLAEFKNRMYGENTGALDAPRSNLMGTLLNVAEQKEALANQPKPSMIESLSVAAQNPPRVDTMASQMSAADKANSAAKAEAAKADDWLKPKAGEASYKSTPGLVDRGLSAVKQGLGSLGPRAGELLSKVAVPADIYGVSKELVGNPFPLAYQAITGNKPPQSVASAELPNIVSGVNFNAPSDRAFNPSSPISATGANDYESLANLKPNDIQRVTDRLKGLWGGDANSAQPDAGTVPPTQVTPPTQTSTQTPTQVAPPTQTPDQTTQQGAIYKDNGVTKTKNSVTVTPDKHKDLDAMSNAHKQPDVQPNQVSEALQKVAAAQQAISAIERRPNEEGQGSILDSLYSKLKDSDVDYSDLAKRISQNEYDLARERKDGTFNAILGGVGAALTQAGTYQGVGDRVFKPGLGTIAGAGIMGGLKMSAASDEAISKKSQDNMTAMIALKKLKRESMNDVLDALSAQKQNEVYAQSVANNAMAHRDTATNQRAELGVKLGQLELAAQQAGTETELRLAQINKLHSELDPKKQAAADLLKTQLTAHTTALDNISKTPGVMADDPRLIAAANKLKNTNAEIDALLQGLGVNTNLVPNNTGSSGAKTTEQWNQEGFFKR